MRDIICITCMGTKMVYVQHKNGEALMPTTNAKARILLKSKKAKVVEIRPFTIQLEYETTDHVQDLTLGIDAGYLNIGFCVLSKSQEYLVGTLLMLMGMQKRLEERAMYRNCWFRRRNWTALPT